jgi:hypothetical protein
MTRFLFALAAIVSATTAAAAPPPNSFSERLRALPDLQRRAALRAAINDSAGSCGRVEAAELVGPYRNLVMWNVRCTRGGDYGLFIGPDGSVQVRTCDDLAKLKLPTCRLPAAAPAAKRSGARR